MTTTPNQLRVWIAGARPRTLPAAVVPVAVGAAAAVGSTASSIVWWRVAAALAVSLLLQIGVNYANDYSDGVRGTDDVRVGPVRLVASGLVPAKQVKIAALATFGLAALCGLALAAATSWWMLAVGAAAIAAAWGYTGGPKPYGYLGLGEVFVFVFFGVVATVGTTFVAIETVPAVAWVASIGVGALACALLVINNLRDIPTDTAAGKQTLAVRLGDHRTRWFFTVLVGVAGLVCVVAVPWAPWALLGLLATPLAVQSIKRVMGGVAGHDLIAVLGETGRLQLVYGVLVAVGLVIS